MNIIATYAGQGLFLLTNERHEILGELSFPISAAPSTVERAVNNWYDTRYPNDEGWIEWDWSV